MRITFLFLLVLASLHAQQAVRIDNDDLGGTVTSSKGPEAGVWVIAETTDLPTKYTKIAVTDDRGRFPGSNPPETTLTEIYQLP